jgi:uncharacterized MAPEG superfamily protein
VFEWKLAVFSGALTPEAASLVWSGGLGMVHLLVVAHFQRQQYELRWIASARDEPHPPLAGVGGRLERALRNYLETYPFFLAFVFAAVLTHRTNAWTAWGAFTYVWARIAYVPLYASGIPLIRSLAWNVAAFGSLAVLLGLILG